MIKKEIDSVKLFHKKFNIDYLNVPKANIPLETKELRFKLMEEENLEYLKATKENNLIEIETAVYKELNSLLMNRIQIGGKIQ